jgi:hypothetical protein
MAPTLDERLDALRGGAPAKHHNARTLAALANNPRCSLRAVLDAAGADKGAIAAHAGFPAPFGQSRFALARGNSFEALVKADGCAELLRLLRETLHLPLEEVAYDDLELVGDDADPDLRYARTRRLLLQAAQGGGGTFFDHPMLRLPVGGQPVYLEPDLVAFRIADRFHVVEIKSFAIIDGQADSAQVKAATTQAAAYVVALRSMLADGGIGPEAVSDRIVLVAPKDFSSRPTAALVDARKQISTLARQLARIERIGALVGQLPEGLTFDLAADGAGRPTRPRAELSEALAHVETNYRPDCLAHCEMAFYCRDQARASSSVDVLGPVVREQLGGIDTVATALGLADGSRTPDEDQAQIAAALRHAADLYARLPGAAA